MSNCILIICMFWVLAFFWDLKLVKIFFSSVGYHFVQIMVSSLYIRSHSLIFLCGACAINVLFRMPFNMPGNSRIFFTFSSFIFNISVLILRSWILLELSFVQVDKYRSYYSFSVKPSSLIKTISWRSWISSGVHIWILYEHLSVIGA